MFEKRLIVITGHYGAGKTNIAVNFAQKAAKEGKKCLLVDLDIVNPYFRSADNRAVLQEFGIQTLIPPFANTNVDIPMLPDGYRSIFSSDKTVFVDVGGDSDGATVLHADKDYYEECGYEMLYVVNFRRIATSDAQSAFAFAKSIENASGLRFSGIINNTNLGAETVKETVTSSFSQAEALSKLMSLPVICTSVIEGIDQTVNIKDITKHYFTTE